MGSSDLNPIKKLLSRAYEWFCRSLFKFYCPIEVRGAENLPEPPYILCSNHCSHLDTPILMLAAKHPFSRFGMVVAKDYFFGRKSKKQWLSFLMNLLPIDRKPNRSQIESHIRLCQQFCHDKKRILIFYPEGTRSKSGKMQPFKKGAALYASQLNLPIIPVHIEGTFKALPKGSRFIRPAKIRVRIGTSFGAETERTAALRETTSKLESMISSLKDSHD